jgi:hypothetical protein
LEERERGMERIGRVWWKHEQTAWCGFCWQGYPWELHVACVACDRPVCPLCIQRQRQDDHEAGPGHWCPDCVAEDPPTLELSP